MDKLNQLVGRQVANIRKKARPKITQETLAERAGVTPYFISKLERGKTAASIKTLSVIAQVLNVPLKVLFDFENEVEAIVQEIIFCKRDGSGKIIEKKTMLVTEVVPTQKHTDLSKN